MVVPVSSSAPAYHNYFSFCCNWGQRTITFLKQVPLVSSIINLIEQLFQKSVDKAETPSSQPSVEANGWGTISLKVDDRSLRFRDVAIYPNAAEEWDWRWNPQSPMHHVPGIRIQDVDQFLSHSPVQPEVIILSQGRGHGGGLDNPGAGQLQIESNVESHLRKKGFSEIYLLKTAPALQLYEKLRAQGKKIFALIHTTC